MVLVAGPAGLVLSQRRPVGRLIHLLLLLLLLLEKKKLTGDFRSCSQLLAAAAGRRAARIRRRHFISPGNNLLKLFEWLIA